MALNFYNYTPSAQRYGEIKAPEPVKTDEPGLLGNMGRAAGSGALSAAGGIFDFVGAQGIAKQFYGWSDDARRSMSQEAQTDMAKPFFGENEQGEIELGEGLADIDTWLLTLASVAGQFAPTAIPGAGIASAATKALSLGQKGAGFATAAGMGATGGAAATGQGMEQARQEWLQMPDEVKMQSEFFKESIRKTKQSNPDLVGDELWTAAEQSVAEQLAKDVQTDPAILLANFAGSAIADPIIGKALTGARLAKSGAFRSAAKGFAVEGGTEAAQAGIQEQGINRALSQIDGRDPMEGVAVAALNEGLAGGAFGGTAGLLGGFANRKQPEPVRDKDADAIRDSNPLLALGFDGIAQSNAQRQADMESIISGVPAISQPVLEGELVDSLPATMQDNQQPARQPRPSTPYTTYAGQIEDKDIIFAGDGRDPYDVFQQEQAGATRAIEDKNIIFAPDNSGVKVDHRTRQPFASEEAALKSKTARQMRADGLNPRPVQFGDGWGLVLGPQLLAKPIYEGEYISAADERAMMDKANSEYRLQIGQKDVIFAEDRTEELNAAERRQQGEAYANNLGREARNTAASQPKRIEDKNIIFAGDGRPQQEAQRSAAVPRLPQKDIIFAGDQSGVTVKASGKPFQSPKEALASKSAREAKKLGQEIEAVKFADGYGWQAVAPVTTEQAPVVTNSDQAAVTPSPETDKALQDAQAMPAAEPVAKVEATPAQEDTGSLDNAEPAADLAGAPIDQEWTAFADDTGTRKIPRAEMPQIKAEHRGAMVQFMKGRDITHEQDAVPATDLKPTQEEFSSAKVKKAMEFEGGNRSILVSSDGYVLDGHHQWLAAREKGEQVDVIRLNAPIDTLIPLAREFPSSTVEDGATEAVASPTNQAQEQPATTVSLPEILRTPKSSYIKKQAKSQKLRESSPGYAQALSKLYEQYDADYDRALAGLTFEQFNEVNKGVPESLNRQAYAQLREDFGLPEQPEKSANEPSTPIEDFGEKLGGARKDVWGGFSEAISGEVDTKELPLSKSFPEPDYVKMAADGVPMETLAIIAAMRAEIPTKPRVSYKARRWAEKVDVLRSFARDLIGGELTPAQVIAAMSKGGSELQSIADAIPAIAQANPETIKLAAKYRLGSGTFSMFQGQDYRPAKTFYFPQNGRSDMLSLASDNKKTALDNLIKLIKAEAAANPDTPGQKQSKISVYQNRLTKQVYLGWEGGSGVLRIQNFDSIDQAREALKNNRPEIEAKLKALKATPDERRPENRSRVGIERFAGSVTPAIFADTFGFRGVEFGNYVEQSKRQKDLNEAYDALMDLADVLGIPPKALALNGELGIAFGARGKGGQRAAKAHYERSHIAINMTKESGAGSLAHEWWHAVDNYFARKVGKPESMATDGSAVRGPEMRKEVRQAFSDVMSAIKSTGVVSRSSRLDERRSKPYWSTTSEASARSFEAFIISELESKGFHNDYLANILEPEAWNALEEIQGNLPDQTYPYPTKAEQATINPAFSKLFDTLQTKETDKGTMLFSKTVNKPDAERYRSELSASLKSLKTNVPVIKVGQTPDVLVKLGVPNLELGIWRDTVRKAVNGFKHSVSMADIEKLPEHLSDPIAVFKSKSQGKVVLIDALDSNGDPVVVAIHMDQKEGRGLVINRVASLYGKENAASALVGFELEYLNENKNPELVRHLGLIPRSGSPSRGSEQNVLTKDDLVKENPDIQFATANTIKAKPSKGINPKLARQLVDGLMAKLNGAAGIKVVILETQAEAEALWQMSLDGDLVRGAYNRANNTAYVIAENIKSINELREAVAHEVIGHGGLQNVIDKADYDAFIERLKNTRNNKAFEKQWAQIDHDYEGFSENDKAEELFAYFVQNKPVSGPIKLWWNAMKRFLHRALVKAGLAKAGDPDVEAMQDVLESIMFGFQFGRNSKPLDSGVAFSGKKDITQTAAFKRWFGDSKVVDESGKPLVVYHGSTAKISEFKQGGDGIWFAEDSSVSDQFGDQVGEYFLRSERHLDMTDRKNESVVDDIESKLYDDGDLVDSDGNPESLFELTKWGNLIFNGRSEQSRVIKEVRRRGYTGLKWADFHGDGVQIVHVVFEPEQIKSATGNNGDFDPSNPDIRFSKTKSADTRTAKEKLGLGDDARETVSEQAKRFTEETIGTLKSSSFWKRLNEGIFDGLAGIKQAEDAAGVTDPNKQGYVSARLASGLADVLHGVFNYGAPVWRDGVVQRKADTKGLLEVFGMLGDDLNNWLAWMGANRAEKLMAEGRENNLTAEDIAELKALADGKEKLFEEVRKEYNKINSAVIDLAEEAGLISKEQRAGFDEEWYVPFFRNMENEVDPEMAGIASMVHGPRSRNGLAGQSAQIKELKGGKQSTKDLLENIIARQSTMIDAALKNKAMLEIAENLAGTPFMQPVKSADIAALSQTELNLLSKVKVMRNGKAEAYAVTDPALLRGLLQINDAGSKSLFNKLARGAKRFLTAGITLSPDFIFKNFVRDAAHAWMINKDEFKFGSDSIKGLRKAFAEDEAYRDLIFSGAAFQGGYVHGGDPEAGAQQIRRALRSKGLGEAQIESYMSSLVTKGGQLLEKYRNASDKVENANRLSTYEAAMAAGKSRRQAAFEAKDLMDYSLKGNFALIGTMIDMLPFFNARLQGMSKLVRSMKGADGDRVLKVLSANLAMKGLKVAAFSLALAALNDDDERYQELPDWDKDANWHFWIGDDHFRIPKPFELGIMFGTMPERMFNYAAGNQTGSDLGKSVAHAVWNTMALNPIPQIALPVVEVMTNKSFFKGSPIEGMADENKQAQDRYNAYTSDIAKMIGDAFGVSPKKVEHIVVGYTGTIGSYVLGVADIVARQALGIEKADTPISRYPVIKAFYQGDAPKTSTKFQDEFYDALETANQAYGSYKRAVEEGDVVRQQELIESESKALGARAQLAKMQRQLSELNKRSQIVNNNSALNGQQKREQLDEITRRKNAIFNSAYARYKLGEW